MNLVCHSSSGNSGEEEKGQSQEVDQKVSCASFPYASVFFFFSLGIFYILIMRKMLNEAFLLPSNACLLNISCVCVDLNQQGLV